MPETGKELLVMEDFSFVNGEVSDVERAELMSLLNKTETVLLRILEN